MSLLAALLAGASVWLLMPYPPRLRARRLVRVAASSPSAGSPPWLAPLASASIGLAALLFLGVVAGASVTLLSFFLLPRLLARLQTREQAATERILRRQLPPAVDLLAATLAAGVPVGVAVDVVARAQDEPLRGHLSRVATALDLGATGAEAWGHAGSDFELQAIGMAFARSAATGSPLSGLLSDVATDLRQRRRTELEVLAREAGVRSFVPLAVCFLPAFIVLAGLPTVVTMAQGTGLLDGLSP